MIYSLSGKLVLKEPSLAVIECGGVGYACRTTEKTLQGIGGTGSDVKLLTYLYVREDIIELFGFLTKQELECFKMLMAVSGVGAKTALAILSDMGTEKFMLSVASGDSKAFLKTKGIGAKTAQRIILDLKDKVSSSDIKECDYRRLRSSKRKFFRSGRNHFSYGSTRLCPVGSYPDNCKA